MKDGIKHLNNDEERRERKGEMREERMKEGEALRASMMSMIHDVNQLTQAP
ncbi:protein of unknown function [Candidatus Nitrosocaldus cavascurensis]|uniref:Uncharacterized protein n=1 Tax=Candidatus Nitrosocaldus cavascurensis TaxID=2058097 RepID=A0A2K5AQB5_9ARCH|nr:protein of unknown function [Candidatus Nitrosocaldus cavascurensis]